MRQADGETGDAVVYGSSPEIQSVLKVVAQVAPRGEHLTIIGEPGSGKRLIGRLIHRSSPRSSARHMHCSCAGLSESVVEGELFGRADGHAGGDGSRQVGCLELCDHGTLLIDEIRALPRRTQEKLLKCMTRRSFHLPGRGTRSADVRIIATSTPELEEKVQEGRFHRELFDRLQGIRIHVPPLRQRRSDIPILVDHYVREAARGASQPLNGVDASALARLMQYDWPGNVQELRDIVGHAVSRAGGPVAARRRPAVASGTSRVRFQHVRRGSDDPGDRKRSYSTDIRSCWRIDESHGQDSEDECPQDSVQIEGVPARSRDRSALRNRPFDPVPDAGDRAQEEDRVRGPIQSATIGLSLPTFPLQQYTFFPEVAVAASYGTRQEAVRLTDSRKSLLQSVRAKGPGSARIPA